MKTDSSITSRCGVVIAVLKKSAPPHLLLVGRLGFEKRVDRLKTMLDLIPGARLAIVGMISVCIAPINISILFFYCMACDRFWSG